MIPKRTTEHVPIANATPFVVWTVHGAVRPPKRSLTVVVKATWRLAPEGELLLAEEQRVPSGDVRDGHVDDHAAPLGYASDFAPIKARADITLRGFGYPAPGVGNAGAVEVAVGDAEAGVRKRVAVFGPRRWSALGVQSEPAPFERVALSWRFALGGTGLGPEDLPQLEDPDRLMVSPSDSPPPVCFAPLAPEAPERQRWLGTYDAKWVDKTWPFFAVDFDRRFFNAAPRQLQCAFLRGDEPFQLHGVRPGGAAIRGVLPGRGVSAFAQLTEEAGGGLTPISMHLDTVHFDTAWGDATSADATTLDDASTDDASTDDADAMEVVMLWRGVIELEDIDGSEIAALIVLDHEVGGAPEREQATIALGSLLPDEGVEDADADEEPAPRPAVVVTREQILEALSSERDLRGIDWAGADLSGLNLAGRDLTGAILSGANLSQTCLRGACLAEALLDRAMGQGLDLRGADLSSADLSGAQLSAAKFEGAKLADATLDGATVDDADFTEAKAAHSSWVGVVGHRLQLDEADLTGCDFSGATLRDAWFTHARLHDAMLYDVDAEAATFDLALVDDLRADGANLRGASFGTAHGRGACFEGAELTGAVLCGSTLLHANFARARMDGARVSGCVLHESSWRKASAMHIDLRGSDLMRADFQDARFNGADLRGSSLYAVETWGACFDGARFDGATMAGTKLEAKRG